MCVCVYVFYIHIGQGVGPDFLVYRMPQNLNLFLLQNPCCMAPTLQNPHPRTSQLRILLQSLPVKN